MRCELQFLITFPMAFSHTRMLTIIGLLFCFYGHSCCWVAIAKIPKNPEYPEKCYIAKGILGNGEPLKHTIVGVGKTRKASPGHCFQFTCDSYDEENFSVSLTGCGSVAGPDECRIVERKDLLFPKCCPAIVC